MSLAGQALGWAARIDMVGCRQASQRCLADNNPEEAMKSQTAATTRAKMLLTFGTSKKATAAAAEDNVGRAGWAWAWLYAGLGHAGWGVASEGSENFGLVNHSTKMTDFNQLSRCWQTRGRPEVYRAAPSRVEREKIAWIVKLNYNAGMRAANLSRRSHLPKQVRGGRDFRRNKRRCSNYLDRNGNSVSINFSNIITLFGFNYYL
mmetsp:Transcript_456/g.663  ORF Transcript_456/g.663 Transcript_456/m.663 type:complete len:205 (-) Transcript_456:763-1377(-)